MYLSVLSLNDRLFIVSFLVLAILIVVMLVVVVLCIIRVSMRVLGVLGLALN